ncbi:hypothetical protein [Celerinatantimonas sp. YJH-8]|uniref:hypothetical protein n=1 Tax=Celerinatantimonas sp. YJH-8 TaxID=3228714 RepID=UPI0038C37863
MMSYVWNGLQLLGLTLLLGQWLVRSGYGSLLSLSAEHWKKIEAGLLLLIMIGSTGSALRIGQKPWFEIWYAEQIGALMVGTILMRICFKYYQRRWVRIIIGLGICGWLIIAAKAGIHHRPIGLS